MLKNYAKILKMIQSLKIKWLAQAVLYLAPVLIAAHIANNIDFGDKPENEDYKSEGPSPAPRL